MQTLKDDSTKKYNCATCRYPMDGGFVCNVCIAKILDEMKFRKGGKEYVNKKTDRNTETNQNDTCRV